MRPLKIRPLLAAVLLAVATLGASSGGVAAYGRAEQPLAQIEFSANCNNPDFPLCFPPPNGFGLGGVWFWIEIDNNPTGTGDIAGAGCGHIRGVGGGAGPIRGEITWTGGAATGEVFFVDPNNKYYNVTLPGSPVALSFPQTQGHYSFRPAPAVTIQLEVAP